jgi:hypothetical protein
MNWIEKIDVLLVNSPLLLQLAKSGIWENAWQLDWDGGMPRVADIRGYLLEDAEDVALEIFFKTTRGRHAYFGLRYGEGFCPGMDRFGFLSAIFRAAFSSPTPTFQTIVNDISGRLCKGDETLFPGDPDRIDMGVVNWWKSMGIRTIWKKGEPKHMGEEDLLARLAGDPHLLHNSCNYVGLEFKYFGGCPHWISFQVSRKMGNDYILSTEEVLDNLSFLADFQTD